MARALIAALAAVLLSSCGEPLLYAEMEVASVAVTQTLPTLPGSPPVDVPTTPLPADGFDLKLGDIKLGGETEKSRVTLNGAVFEILNPTSPETTFAGIRRAELILLPAVGTSGPPVTLALYDRARDGAATTRLAMQPVGAVNLLPYLSAEQVRVQVVVGGVAPGPLGGTWTADLTVDLHVKARVEYR
ncbi:MAG: hypothetical protein HZB56_20010 [Deltaproteobacteria bacterium]|nr:hypothetical protein [Deltaproteobacteria bacterium]